MTESQGNGALMLVISLHHYHAKQKHNAQHTYIAIHWHKNMLNARHWASATWRNK